SFTITDNISTKTTPACTGQCSVTVPINPCAPCIQVTKAVTCAPAGFNGVCDANSGTYGPFASGAIGSTQPVFCYKITVSNCGDEDLINLSIHDPDLPGLTLPTTLPVGSAPVVLFASKSWGVGFHTNTVTVGAIGVNSGQSACLA